MDFGLSEPQALLQSSIRDFVAQSVPISRVRGIMETDSGGDRELHRQLGEQGIAGLLVPEEYDGVGLDLLDACVAAQELARGAVPVSFHSAYVMAPLLLAGAGTEEQKREWLPRIAEGTAIVSVIPGGGPSLVDGRLTGEALFVPDSETCDAYLVAVEHGGTTRVFLARREADGVETTALRTIDDTRRVGEVRFDDVAADELTGGDARKALDRALAAGRVALSADALGVAQEALQIAVEYAKQREQFNRVIASFQAVKHMCAETIAEVDPVQSLVWYTAYAWDRGLDEADYLVRLLKSHATETASQATTTTTKVFGGIGFTYECDCNLYFKRAGYDRQMLGGPSEMRREAARLHL